MKVLIRAVIYLLIKRLDEIRTPITHDSFDMEESERVNEMIRELEEQL